MIRSLDAKGLPFRRKAGRIELNSNLTMLQRKITSAEKSLLLTPLALLVLMFLLIRKSPEARLNAEVTELAGPNATACGYFKETDLSPANIGQMQDCMRAAFEQKKPFWTQQKKHHINIHNWSEEWDTWKSYVYTPQGEMLTVGVRDESGLRAPEIRRFRWNNPRIITGHGRTYLGCDNESEVYLDFY